MRHHRTKRTRRRGFTLTEMLIVLGILVALAAMVVPRFLGTQKKTDIQRTQAQIGAFRGALEKYYLDNRGFPTTEQGLAAMLTPPAEEGDESGTSDWDGPYLNSDSLPKDAWKRDFQYAYPPERGRIDFPDIWSAGPDGEDNTEDDICSWTVTAEGSGEDEFGSELDQNLDVDIDVDVSPPPGGMDEY